jgi:uncharacterized RDD family membrane protein YckC
MKCPKCEYLGFEPADRCRNCGYEFALRQTPHLFELPLRTSRLSLEPDPDLSIRHEAAVATGGDAPAPRVDAGRAPQDGDLPLFGGASDPRQQRVRAAPPRPPLAVRRAAVEVSRGRERPPREATLDLEPPDDVVRRHGGAADRRQIAEPIPSPGPAVDAAEKAGLGARLSAVLVDLAILAAIDLAVVYFTMKICGLTPGELALVPRVPLLMFLIIQNGGYLVAFTSTGQTLGKMMTGVRVVPDEAASGPLDAGRSMLRAGLWLLLALPAGLGFLPALFSRDGRGLHDRLAGTRVVRAS